jgi:endonuclease YncB( thermonuclease family)
MPARWILSVAVVFSLAVVTRAGDGPLEREREREREREYGQDRDREYGRDRERERERAHRYITGRVVSVDDGDTCTVLDREGIRHRVCLYGLDAPERGQANWERAKEALARKIAEKEIRFETVEKDREGRELCHLYLGNRHINLEQVREGYGWHHTERERIREFAEAERDARDHQRGLWVDRHPVEPWKYRAEHPVRDLGDRQKLERDRLEREREARRDRERVREEREVD